MMNRKDLEQIINDKAKQNMLNKQPLTKQSLKRMKLLPE